jgi:hypothetical protein
MEESKIKHYDVRIGNLEVRIPSSPSKRGLEIVQWGESSCWVIAYWQEHREGGFFMSFVGNRPFVNSVSPSDFWTLARAGQEFLDEWKD